MSDLVDNPTEEEDPELVPSPASKKPLVVRVRNYIDPKQLKIDLSYSTVDLSTAMVEQAQRYVEYAGYAAKASRQVDDIAMLLEITESKVYRKLRDGAVKSGAKLTEVQLEKSVSVHPQVVQMKRARNEAKQIEANAKAAAEAFKQRRDMLIQEGAKQRQERDGEVAINARRERERASEATIQRIQQKMEERSGS
jgi:hypothetical protein